MKLPSPKATAQTLTVTAVMAGVLFMVGILLYVLLAQQMGNATGELQAKQKAVGDANKVASRIVESQQKLEETKLKLSCLESSVATYEYVPTLLKQLETLGKSMSLNVLSVRPQPIVEDTVAAAKPAASGENQEGEKSAASSNTKKKEVKPYKELKIEIEVEGTYWNTRNFMYRLTKFPKIIAVNQIQMSPAGLVIGRNSPKLQVRLSVTAFIFPDKESGKEQVAPTPSTSASGTERRSSNEG